MSASASSAAAAPRVRALVFDVFGTVVDWRSGIVRDGAALSAAKGVDVDWPAFADAWRAGYQPAMQRVRSGEIPPATVDRLHRAILDDLLPRFGLAMLDENERDALNRVWHRLDPWPDAVAALARLKRRFPIATLSNGNVSLLVDMARRAHLPWDCVLSSEMFPGRFTPDPEVYLGAARLLDVAPAELLIVAAHPSDLAGAANAGLATAYVPRPLEYGAGSALRDPPGERVFDLVARDFHALAAQLGA
jgi:2-haloacid dehalogenase